MAQPVALVTTREPRDYRLLELPPELDEAISSASDVSLAIHGRLTDDAALVTKDATYAVRQVSQTNSLLLCGPAERNGALELQIHKNATDILELVPMAARLDRIPELLQESEYAGERAESVLKTRKYTPREVRSVVQASTLNQLDILACEAASVPVAPVVDALVRSDSQRQVAEALLGWFGSVAPDGHVSLDTKRIARLLGIGLLRRTKRKPLSEFMHEWRSLLGALAADAHVPLLEGFFLLHPPPASFATASVHANSPDASAGKLLASLSIEYVPHTALSPVPVKRFKELFSLRPQWVAEEIRPYIATLAVGNAPEKRGAALEKLLLTHARGIRSRWSTVHGAVLLRGEQDAERGSENCLVYQARVKYA
ncbi:Ctf8p and Ctf18p associating protein [Malassezia cuniculi]|uniref:Ctf8p and Ctf18p associating protein n=1 Tax=Malassezia cuniculi TaxID=948313 RepID=A0AAF0ETZ5_9BASI|nr:Ctf8p and Ctf18p associating protein [Malassezia cuniculi]